MFFLNFFEGLSLNRNETGLDRNKDLYIKREDNE